MTELAAAFRFLKSLGWLSTIEPRFQDALQAEARLIHAKRGAQLFDYGDAHGGLFGVVEGAFLISYPRED